MFGYRVIATGNGAEAIELYIRHAADVALLLTDMTMPEMDGPATIEALARLNPKLKVIAASGLMPDSYPTHSGPGTAFLSKPYTAENLLGTVHEVLHGNLRLGINTTKWRVRKCRAMRFSDTHDKTVPNLWLTPFGPISSDGQFFHGTEEFSMG